MLLLNVNSLFLKVYVPSKKVKVKGRSLDQEFSEIKAISLRNCLALVPASRKSLMLEKKKEKEVKLQEEN